MWEVDGVTTWCAGVRCALSPRPLLSAPLRYAVAGRIADIRSSDSMSPPPSRADSPSYAQYYNGNGNGREGGSGSASGSASAAGGAAPPSNSTPPRRPEPLVKQTYSTSMTHPVTGKTKKFHVVAYSSKVGSPFSTARANNNSATPKAMAQTLCRFRTSCPTSPTSKSRRAYGQTGRHAATTMARAGASPRAQDQAPMSRCHKTTTATPRRMHSPTISPRDRGHQ